MVESTSEANPFQVLVVEDEPEIRELICLLLLRQGLRVQGCGSVHEADEYIRRSHFDLLVLDWMLPHFSGVDFLKSLRSRGQNIPVLMVTAKSEPQDIVQGLEAGADDFMTKPFDSNVLIARAKSLLRRLSKKENSDQLRIQDKIKCGLIEINQSAHECHIEGELVHLTPSEFKILTEMMFNQGRVLTRESLVERVQGEGISVTGRTIDTHVFGLRKKMRSQADWIETIRGVGYRIKAE